MQNGVDDHQHGIPDGDAGGQNPIANAIYGLSAAMYGGKDDPGGNNRAAGGFPAARSADRLLGPG
jgi:hypothetical protein